MSSQFFTRDIGENIVNVDLSARCGLECYRCQRQTYYKSKINKFLWSVI